METMMNKQFLISVVVMFVATMAAGFVVHGYLLAQDYAALPNLFRPEADAQNYFHYMILAHVLIAIGLTWIYRMGRDDVVKVVLSIDELTDETRDMHRAITSLMEELEAIDWYNQRVDACKDPELRAILAHNRDEEKEHAAMVLEWIRRHDPTMDHELKDYLFTDKPIAHG